MSIVRPIIIENALAASRIRGLTSELPSPTRVRELQSTVEGLLRAKGGLGEAIERADTHISWFAHAPGDAAVMRPLNDAARTLASTPEGATLTSRMAALVRSAPEQEYRIGIAATNDAYEGVATLEASRITARSHAASPTPVAEDIAEQVMIDVWMAGSPGAFASRETDTIVLAPQFGRSLGNADEDASKAAFILAHELRHAANPRGVLNPLERVDWFQEAGASIAAMHDVAASPHLAAAGLDAQAMLAHAENGYRQHLARLRQVLVDAGRDPQSATDSARFADDFTKLHDIDHLDGLITAVAARTGTSPTDAARRILQD